MNATHLLKRTVGGALLSGVAVIGVGLVPGAAQAQPGLAPQSYGPVIADAPAPPPPPPPPAPRKVCWALFLPAPCPPLPH
jgi:hypothetical protein